MSKVSKTARASAVQTTAKASVIPDAELIRHIRLDREARLYPTVQGADALLRAFDEALKENAALRIVAAEAAHIAAERGTLAEQRDRQATTIVTLLARVEELEQSLATVINPAAIAEAPYADQVVYVGSGIPTSNCLPTTEPVAA